MLRTWLGVRAEARLNRKLPWKKGVADLDREEGIGDEVVEFERVAGGGCGNVADGAAVRTCRRPRNQFGYDFYRRAASGPLIDTDAGQAINVLRDYRAKSPNSD